MASDGSGVITATLALTLDSTDWRIGGNTIRVDFGPYGDLYLLGGSESTHLTVTPQVVSAFPEAGLCLNDGSISVEKMNGDTIFVTQGTTGYPIPKDVPFRVTGSAEMTANTITVTGADVHIILDNVNQGGGDSWRSPITIEQRYDWDADTKTPSNVTLTLEGNNALAVSGDCSQGITIREGCTLTIEGPGSLKIGNEHTYVGIGIGEMHEFGHVVINGGTVDITAQDIAIGTEMMMHGEEKSPSITINGGVVKTDVKYGGGVGIGTRRAYEGGVDIAIHGGSLELFGEGNSISASGDMHSPPDSPAPGSVTITGGSIAAGSVSPAPVNQSGASLFPAAIGTGKPGAVVGGMALSIPYGAPAQTDGNGDLTLYLPEGEYTGLVIIDDELQTVTVTASQATPGSGFTADTGIRVETPKNTKPDIRPDGSIDLPGGSQVTKGDTVITLPAAGGTVTPDLEKDVITVPVGAAVQTGEGPAVTLPGGGVADLSGNVSGDKVQIGNTTVTGKGTTVTSAGEVTIPVGGTVQAGESTPITLPDGGTMDAMGGVRVPGGSTVQIGDTVITPPSGGVVTPGKNGAVTVPGGSTVQTGTGEAILIPSAGGSITPGGEIKYTVTVTWSVNGTETTTQVVNGDTPVFDTVPAKAPTDTEVFTFTGWEPEPVPAAEDVTYTARFSAQPRTYTVTLNANGGTVGSGNVTGYTCGTAVELPTTVTREGYIFDGWYGSADCSGATVTRIPANATGDKIYYAGWTARPGGGGGFSGGSASSRKPSAAIGGDGRGGKAYPGEDGSVTIAPDEGYEIVKITVNGKEVEFPEDGKLIGLKRTDKVVVTFGEIPKPTPVSQRFVDVKAGAWYENDVQFAVDSGLFNGTSDTTFSPNGAMTRGMLATVLWRLEGSPTAAKASGFDDVTAGAWYAEAVRWATGDGIVEGYNGGALFGPDDPITREQLAVMLWRYAKAVGRDVSTVEDALSFADAGEISEWATAALKWAVKQGIATGKSGNILDPQGQATRAEVAAMLMRFLSGAEALTSTEFLILGSGQVRE